MKAGLKRINFWTALIFFLSFVLLGLSISELVLEQNVLHALENWHLQFPGSSLAEWLFVPLNPRMLDAGPTNAIMTVGALGIVAGVCGMGWCWGMWCGQSRRYARRIGIFAGSFALLSTATSLAVLVYVFVVESDMKSPPALYKDWQFSNFTREFYLCVAIPSIIADPERYYGFPVCKQAEFARYNLVGVSAVSLLLALLCIVQMYTTGLFKQERRPAKDVEKGVKMPRKEWKGWQPQIPGVKSSPIIQKPQEVLDKSKIRVREYYNKL